MNLNIHKYWLPGKCFKTAYADLVVISSIMNPVTKPVLDFLYPNKMPNTITTKAANPK